MHEVTRWMTGLCALVGFGLAMGLNPALYGATADMLARGVRAWPRLGAMLGGLIVGATTLVLVLQAFDPTRLVTMIEADVDAAALDRTVDLVAGIALFLTGGGIAVWKRVSPRLPTREQKGRRLTTRPMSYFVLGLSSAVVGFTTLPLMYMTGRVTSGLSDDIVARVLAYGVFLVALIAPFVALAWLWSRFPRVSRAVGESYATALTKDYRTALAVALGVCGVALVVFALMPRA